MPEYYLILGILYTARTSLFSVSARPMEMRTSSFTPWSKSHTVRLYKSERNVEVWLSCSQFLVTRITDDDKLQRVAILNCPETAFVDATVNDNPSRPTPLH